MQVPSSVLILMLTLASSPRIGVRSEPCSTLGSISTPSKIFSVTEIGTNESEILLNFSVVLLAN